MRSFLVILFTVAFSHFSYSQIGGQTVFGSLDIPAAARVAAAGGLLPAVADGDVNLALYNPSLLDSTTHQKLGLSYVNYFSGINLGFASYAHHLDSSNITLAATMQYVNYGDFTERDAAGNDLGSFRAGDYALTIGAAKPIDSLFTIGANAKVIYSNLATYNALGVAVDAGITYRNPKRLLTAALVLRNLGVQVNGYTSDVRDTLPANLMISVSKKLRYAPFRFSVTYDQMQLWDLTNGEETGSTIDPLTGELIEENNFKLGDQFMRHITLGTELLLGDNFNVQVGYNYRRRQEMKLADRPGTAGLSWGLGLRIKRFDISYARASYHLAGGSNHFTISTRLGS